MELQQFITETLVALYEGVNDAKAKHPGIAVANFTKDEKAHRAQNMQPVNMVEFDIAVTVSDKSGAGVKAGINVLSFIGAHAGTELQENKENSTVSRVKFSVPVLF